MVPGRWHGDYLQFQVSNLAAQEGLSRVQAVFSTESQASCLCHRYEKPQLPQFARIIPYLAGMHSTNKVFLQRVTRS